MKTETWIPKPAPLPRTLADVESSREKPVLCWFSDGSAVCPMWINGNCVWRANREGMIVRCNGKYTDFRIYDQTSRPTKLEDVPDRMVIWSVPASEDGTRHGVNRLLWFRSNGEWFVADEAEPFDKVAGLRPDPNNWQLTDHAAELVETEIGVV